MVVSDHSPCTPDLKLPGEKDFMNSWGGISSLQFGLSLLWTGSRTRQFSLQDINRLLSLAPAKLAGSTVLNISSVKLYVTHLCPISKSKFNLYMKHKSDRVNLVAPASPVNCLLY